MNDASTPSPADRLTEIEAKLRAQEDEKAIKAQIEVSTKAFDRNAAYNNTLLVAGYAGAFTIWSFTRAQIPDRASIAIALALIVSLTSFIVFEVVKTAIVGQRVMKQAELLRGSTSATEKREAIKAMDQAHGRLLVEFMRYWTGTMVISVAGALIAVALLVYNFVAVLLELPRWPS